MPVEIAKRSGRNVMGATVGLVNGRPISRHIYVGEE